MSTDVDWRHELDSSFGHGHDLPPGHYVAAGRTAVRRRRASSFAIVAAMAVGVGAAWASGPGSVPRGDAPVATQGPSPTADAQPTLTRQKALEYVRARSAAIEEARSLGNPAALSYSGLFLVPEAGPVLQRVPNPMDYTEDQGRSVAIRVTMPDGEKYALLTVYPTDSSSAIVAGASGDFDGWLEQAVDSQHTLDVMNGVTASTGNPDGMPWLVLDAYGTVQAARAGITLTQVDVNPDLGEDFEGGASEAGAVRLVVDGRSEFAVYRVIDGELDVVPAGSSFTSMDAFLDWAREQYSSGAGMR